MSLSDENEDEALFLFFDFDFFLLFFSFLDFLLFLSSFAIARASSRISSRRRRITSFSDSAAVFTIALSSLHGPKISGTSEHASPRHSSPKSSVRTPHLVRNVYDVDGAKPFATHSRAPSASPSVMRSTRTQSPSGTVIDDPALA